MIWGLRVLAGLRISRYGRPGLYVGSLLLWGLRDGPQHYRSVQEMRAWLAQPEQT